MLPYTTKCDVQSVADWVAARIAECAVDTDEPAEKICMRMAELRRELVYDMQDVSRMPKAMASPSFYIRKFPWATLAVAAGVGDTLIPKKKKQVVQPDMDAPAELVRKNQVNINTTKAAEPSQGMMASTGGNGIELGGEGRNELCRPANDDGGFESGESRCGAVVACG